MGFQRRRWKRTKQPEEQICAWIPQILPSGGSKKAKDPYHSFKLSCLSRRYQFIFDGKGIVRGLWGGYSPKVHDYKWCEANRQTLERYFDGGVIIADQHYQELMRKIDSPRFITPVRVSSQVRTKGPQDISQNSAELLVISMEKMSPFSTTSPLLPRNHLQQQTLLHCLQERKGREERTLNKLRK